LIKNDKVVNTAISRAMDLLIVVGNTDCLESDPKWKQIVELCSQNGTFYNVAPNFFNKPLSASAAPFQPKLKPSDPLFPLFPLGEQKINKKKNFGNSYPLSCF